MIEDNEDDFILTSELLESSVRDVVWKQTLAAGIAELKTSAFNAILLDLNVPDSQGLETLDRLNAEIDRMPAIIVLTGTDDEELARQTLQRGAQDYIVKGQFSSDLLMRSLRYACERHKFETELRERNEELSLLNDALTIARDGALQASRLKSEFLSNVSHEIRTPLSGIVGVTELLTMEEVPGEAGDLIGILHESAKRLSGIVNDLLDFSKLEAGRMQVQVTDCDVREIINDVFASVRPSAQVKSVQLQESIDETVPEIVRTDAIRFRQVLMNFVHNAVKFTPSGSVRLVALCEQQDDQGYLKVKVVDTGIGVPPGWTQKIFEPFVQADGSTKRNFEGTGLGLAISKKSVELLGGQIGVQSEEGKGSTFWFSVPVNISTAA